MGALHRCAVPSAVRLVKADQVRVLAIPMPSGAVSRRRITVLVRRQHDQ
jgi:hypothetical protein